MDLQNNKIKLGDLLKHEQARGLLESEFPEWANTPLMKMARHMPLCEILRIARKKVDERKIQSVINKLEQL